uniref:Pentraxin family member n=1 Tax=Anabas testudineus TaxID=64144 RepID=A0A7N6BDX5_ANATE
MHFTKLLPEKVFWPLILANKEYNTFHVFSSYYLIYCFSLADQVLSQVMLNITPFSLCTELNVWHSICSTWDSASGLGQVWLDGKPSSRKFISSESNIKGSILIVLGQEQDSYGGGFDITQCFVGMMSDVHMWDYTLSPCEIQNYMSDLTFTPGNVLNWKALDFQITGRVLTEDKQKAGL